MAEYTIRAHERQVEFHQRQVEDPNMPGIQLEIHRRLLQVHLAALAIPSVTELIPNFTPEQDIPLAA